MPFSKNAPGCIHNSIMARWGLTQRNGDKPDTAKPENTMATPQRKAALLFGVDPDRLCAGLEQYDAKKDDQTVRREKIERRMGISLGDKPASEQKPNNIMRAFGVTKQN